MLIIRQPFKRFIRLFFIVFILSSLTITFLILNQQKKDKNKQQRPWVLTFNHGKIIENTENRYYIKKIRALIKKILPHNDPTLVITLPNTKDNYQIWQSLIQKVPQLEYYDRNIINTPETDKVFITLQPHQLNPNPCPIPITIYDPHLPFSEKGLTITGSSNLYISMAGEIFIPKQQENIDVLHYAQQQVNSLKESLGKKIAFHPLSQQKEILSIISIQDNNSDFELAQLNQYTNNNELLYHTKSFSPTSFQLNKNGQNITHLMQQQRCFITFNLLENNP